MSKKRKKKINLHVTAHMIERIPYDIEVKPVNPENCKTPCPYGFGRSFCFPCYGKIMQEFREQRG